MVGCAPPRRARSGVENDPGTAPVSRQSPRIGYHRAVRGWVVVAAALVLLPSCRSTSAIHQQFQIAAQAIDTEYNDNWRRLQEAVDHAESGLARAHAEATGSVVSDLRTARSHLEAQYDEVTRVIDLRVAEAAEKARSSTAPAKPTVRQPSADAEENGDRLTAFLTETLPAWRAQQISWLDAAYDAELSKLEATAEARLRELDKVLDSQRADLERERVKAGASFLELRTAKMAYAQSVRDTQIEEVEAQNRAAAAAILQGVGQGLQQAAANYNAARTQYRPSYNAWTPAAPPRVGSPTVSGCQNDFQCPFGQQCVKVLGSFAGYCAQPVNQLGMPQLSMPRPDSVYLRPYGSEQCLFDTQCPVGFFCEQSAKVCLKR